MTLMRFPIRGLSMRAVLMVGLLSLLYAIALELSVYPGPYPPGPVINTIAGMQVCSFFTMLAVLLVEDNASAGGASVWRYSTAVTCGVGAGILLYWFVSQPLLEIATILPGPKGYEPLPSVAFRWTPPALMACGLATAVYVCRSRASQRLESLRAIQSERVQVERNIAEARFAALQARIEPTEVLARLERIEQLYDQDPPAADAMLDQFVKALRAAIQQANVSEGADGATRIDWRDDAVVRPGKAEPTRP